jgi:RNA polymerase sigma factor (sigma-70 family)
MKDLFATHESVLLSPTALVQRCLHGDADAWRQLVERYARLVHSVPVRHGLSASEVDDVGQEVFLALAQNLHTIEDPERLPAWLITTARRACWRTIQRRRAEQPLEDDSSDSGSPYDERTPRPQLVSPLPTPEEALANWSRQEAIHSALARLGERCRSLLMLIFLDPQEPSYDQISEVLDIPKGSIGPTRNRCLQQLRSHLGHENLDGNE